MRTSFKLWLEDQQKDTDAHRQNFFNQVMQSLQATSDDLSKPLADLPSVKTPSIKNGESQPPQKGTGALAKVQSLLGGLLQRMSNDRADVDTSVRAKRAMDLLTKRGTDGQITPVLYLQDFLRELFGNDFQSSFMQSNVSNDDTPAPPPIGPQPEAQPPQQPPAPQQPAPQQPPMPPQAPPPGMPPKPPGGLQFV